MVNVHVPWNPKLKSTLLWNQVTASILEHFGLPGDRFITHATEDYMEWMFNDNRDRLLFVTAWGHDEL